MLNRLDDVLLTLRLAAERKLESAELLQTQYFVAFLTGNENELRWTATAARKSPATEDIISHIEALALARSGQLQAAGRMAVVHVQIAQKTRPVSAETVPRPCRPCFEVSCRQWTSASAAERNSRPATKAHKCAVRRDLPAQKQSNRGKRRSVDALTVLCVRRTNVTWQATRPSRRRRTGLSTATAELRRRSSETRWVFRSWDSLIYTRQSITAPIGTTGLGLTRLTAPYKNLYTG